MFFQVNAYIDTGRLKSAYLLVVQRGLERDVQRLLAAAEECEQGHIASMCKKWLSNKQKRNF